MISNGFTMPMLVRAKNGNVKWLDKLCGMRREKIGNNLIVGAVFQEIMRYMGGVAIQYKYAKLAHLSLLTLLIKVLGPDECQFVITTPFLSCFK